MKNSIVMICLALFPFGLFAQRTSEVQVTVSDIKKKGEGEVVFMLFYQEDGFPNERKKAFKWGKVKDFGSSATFTFEDVPYGEYAVSVHQDKDLDGEMKRNFIGLPKEPVGASNLTRMGKPNFDKCLFIVNSPNEKIDVKFIIAN